MLEDKRTAGIYHLTGRDATTWYGFAKAIFERSGNSVRVKPISTSEFPTLAKRPAYSILDNSKLSETFDLRLPGYTESLKSCLARIALDDE